MCPVLPHPENGEVLVTGQIVRSIATYICDSEFEIDTDIIQRVCLESGQWSSEAPLCISKSVLMNMAVLSLLTTVQKVGEEAKRENISCTATR